MSFDHLFQADFHRTYVEQDFKRNNQIIPHLSVFFEGSAMMLPVQTTDHATKIMFDLIARRLIERSKANAYLFVTEGWFIIRDSNQFSTVRSIDADDRRECLLYSAGEGGKEASYRYEIHRDADGNPYIDVDNKESNEDVTATLGFMADLFNTESFDVAPAQLREEIDAMVDDILAEHEKREATRLSNNTVH